MGLNHTPLIYIYGKIELTYKRYNSWNQAFPFVFLKSGIKKWFLVGWFMSVGSKCGVWLENVENWLDILKKQLLK